jgi:hypothetical protein
MCIRFLACPFVVANNYRRWLEEDIADKGCKMGHSGRGFEPRAEK